MVTGCKKEEPNGQLGPPPLPTIVYDAKVITSPVTRITGISAFSGGIIVDNSVPTLLDFNFIDLNTRADFGGTNTTVSPYEMKGDTIFCFLGGLHPQTTYYIRALSDANWKSGVNGGSGGQLVPVGMTYGDTISFTTDSIALGMLVNGGIVFYIDSTGEHGLISSQADLPVHAWQTQAPNVVTQATSTTDGFANTGLINYINPSPDQAAISCYWFVMPGWSNMGSHPWFLPAKDQLEKMYLKQDLIGGFSNGIYWSSTEADDIHAFAQDFSNGNQSAFDKNLKYRVRPIKQF
jgi:hypothetical protein